MLRCLQNSRVLSLTRLRYECRLVRVQTYALRKSAPDRVRGTESAEGTKPVSFNESDPVLSDDAALAHIAGAPHLENHLNESQLTGSNDQNTKSSTEHLSESWDRGGLTKSNALSPLFAQIRKLMDANKGCVCLVQVGGFYELYFEQATLVAPKLGIKVAIKKTNNHNVPMSGFPTHQLQKFVKMMVHDLHLTVAIIDQFRGDTETIFHRKVSRIVTPGTLVDESFMNYSRNNYLAAVYIPPSATQLPDPEMAVGIAWLDISVGDFYVQQTTAGDLASDLRRIAPSEVILPDEFCPEPDEPEISSWISELGDLRRYFVRHHKTQYRDLKLQFGSSIARTRKVVELFSRHEEAAMNLALSYIRVNLPDRMLTLDVPTRYISDKFLHMDSRTRDALELTGRPTYGTTSAVGSLFSTIRRTVTSSGTRRLAQWLKLPILNTAEIFARQQLVLLFARYMPLTSEVRSHLLILGDVARSLQRLALKAGSPVVHLQAIGDSVLKMSQLRRVLEREKSTMDRVDEEIVDEFLREFTVPEQIAEKILGTLHLEEIPYTLSRGLLAENLQEGTSVDVYANDEPKSDLSSFQFSVKRDFSRELKRLHAQLDEVNIEAAAFLEDVKQKVQQVDAKAVVSPREQYGRQLNVIHIACKPRFTSSIVDLLVDVREKRASSIIYKPAVWAQLKEKLAALTHDIEAAEREIVETLKNDVLLATLDIRHSSACVDLLDITSSFGILAAENNLCRPVFVKLPILAIQRGRHLVVESSLASSGQMFHSNDVRLGGKSNGNNLPSAWVITGPNMGGKSTFLRQNALIVILAQIGCYVPAQKARLGIVDRIFTRIGASDDLYSDLSTFMVEMIETSNILKNATPRSLAIVDEIGRGTSGREGLAIAYAALLLLVKTNKCRVLFATHFGREIRELLDKDGVTEELLLFYRTKIIEHVDQNGGVKSYSFDHELEPGISERSYAFEVARLAGFPANALKDAERVLGLIDASED